MTLDEDECWARLNQSRHGVLATVHPERGVDAVPAVYAIAGGRIGIPIDTVKPKRHLRLGRLANLDRDGRCVLLVERYSDDWSQLWWVRVHGRAGLSADRAAWMEVLAVRYPPYQEPGAVADVVVLDPTAVTGWAAE